MQPKYNCMPMFPLSLILLPGEEMPLRIFEPRYKQLVAECEQSGRPFAIPFAKGHILTTMGSQVELARIAGRHANGSLVVVVRGTGLLSVLGYMEELPGKLYGGGEVALLENNYRTTNLELEELVQGLRLNLKTSLVTSGSTEGIDMLKVATALMLTSEEKHRLLTYSSNAQREQLLIGQLRLMAHVREQENALENNFQLN